MENLRAWLNGCRDYTSGVVLYNNLGTDEALKRMFAESQTDFKTKRLVKALEELWDARKLPKGVFVPPTIKDLQSDIEDLEYDKENLESEKDELQDELYDLKAKRLKSGWSAHMDDIETALHAQWKPLFLTMTDLMSRLYEVANAGRTNKAKLKEAGKMALEILNLRDQVHAFYNKRDYYLQQGSLPMEPDPVEECLDPKLFGVKYQNAQRYVREYRGKLAKLAETEDKYLATLQQLKKWQDEVAKFKTLLNLD